MKNDNTVWVLTQFIRHLGVRITNKSIEVELEKHPEYPSLLAMSDVLNNWRIPNAAYNLSFDELTQIQSPFIVQLGNEFALVTHLDNKQSIVSNERWNLHKMNIEEFTKLFTGFTLIAEPGEASGETDYTKKRRGEILEEFRIPFILSGLFLILLTLLVLHSSYLSAYNWQIGLLTLFKSTGLAISVLLLMHSIDANNPLVQRLCTGKNKDCNAILSSKAAKITEAFSWSEAGFFYFSGTWLILLFSNVGSLMQALAVLNVLSLPYTFYSIYYQSRVAKQWCMLCCAVQGLLWLEFFVFLPYLMQAFTMPDLSRWSSLLIGMGIPILGWIFIKPYLLQAKQVQPLKQQLRKFKYNTDLFQKMLTEQPRYALLKEEHSIILGNPEAEHIVTIVSNPYCQPCSKAHKTLDEWLLNRDDIRLQVIFPTRNNEKDIKTKVARHFMSLKSKQDDPVLKQAMNDWYEQKHRNYEVWAKEYPVMEDTEPAHEMLERQREWCKMVNIEATPTIFINGHQLPKPYQIEDVRYFI